jgi:uncharacterized protein (TIGR03790 family)
MLLWGTCATAAQPSAAKLRPGAGSPGIGPATLAVVIDSADPLSEAIGRYYAQRRGIPAANIVRVPFDDHRETMPADEFLALKALVDARLPAGIQAYALTWREPFRVGCMSMTAAFAFGVDRRYCASGCRTTQPSGYYDSSSRSPFDDLHIRPAMVLAAASFADARALIDRGVRSDGSRPRGTAYLVISGDRSRDARVPEYAIAQRRLSGRLNLQIDNAPVVDRGDVLFYFIGAVRVSGLSSDRFLPGAVADHLTSTGGNLMGGTQMSALAWLQAGATGSYGTVVEPCNFTAKFPDVALLMQRYLEGETLIEAYWKSVAMPGQGIFIGDPLAAPFAPSRR